MFYYSWPSWLVELGSGLVVASVVQPIPFLLLRIISAVLISVTYESVFDQNGWSWVDIGQRAAGMLTAFLLWGLIRV